MLRWVKNDLVTADGINVDMNASKVPTIIFLSSELMIKSCCQQASFSDVTYHGLAYLPYSQCIIIEKSYKLRPGFAGEQLGLSLEPGNYIMFMHDRCTLPFISMIGNPVESRVDLEIRDHTDTSIMITSLRKTMNKVSEGHSGCDPSPECSVRRCWRDFMIRNAKCQLEWSPIADREDNVDFCKTETELANYQTAFLQTIDKSKEEMLRILNCEACCTEIKYEVHENSIHSLLKGHFLNPGDAKSPSNELDEALQLQQDP